MLTISSSRDAPSASGSVDNSATTARISLVSATRARTSVIPHTQWHSARCLDHFKSSVSAARRSRRASRADRRSPRGTASLIGLADEEELDCAPRAPLRVARPVGEAEVRRGISAPVRYRYEVVEGGRSGMGVHQRRVHGPSTEVAPPAVPVAELADGQLLPSHPGAAAAAVLHPIPKTLPVGTARLTQHGRPTAPRYDSRPTVATRHLMFDRWPEPLGQRKLAATPRRADLVPMSTPLELAATHGADRQPAALPALSTRRLALRK